MSETEHDTRTMARASEAFRAALEVVGAVDPDVAAAIASELADQRGSLKLIASENYASPASCSRWATGSATSTPKGPSGGGCTPAAATSTPSKNWPRSAPRRFSVPTMPTYNLIRVSTPNLVAFWAVLAQRVEVPALAAASVPNVDELDDASWKELRRALGDQRMIGMSLDAGGHLTHGFRRNISGKMFNQRSYGTDPATGLVDYGQVRRLAQEFRPLIVVAGYSAYPRLLNFANYARDRR